MCYHNTRSAVFGFVTQSTRVRDRRTDRQTHRQNYNSQDHASSSIAASRGNKIDKYQRKALKNPDYKPGIRSWVLQVPSCQRLLQTQVERVSDNGCQEDAELRRTRHNDTTLHLAVAHLTMLHCSAAYLPADCHLQSMIIRSKKYYQFTSNVTGRHRGLKRKLRLVTERRH